MPGEAVDKTLCFFWGSFVPLPFPGAEIFGTGHGRHGVQNMCSTVSQRTVLRYCVSGNETLETLQIPNMWLAIPITCNAQSSTTAYHNLNLWYSNVLNVLSQPSFVQSVSHVFFDHASCYGHHFLHHGHQRLSDGSQYFLYFFILYTQSPNESTDVSPFMAIGRTVEWSQHVTTKTFNKVCMRHTTQLLFLSPTAVWQPKSLNSFSHFSVQNTHLTLFRNGTLAHCCPPALRLPSFISSPSCPASEFLFSGAVAVRWFRMCGSESRTQSSKGPG